MFNISFLELLVIFIITFIILGPEKLEQLAYKLAKAVKSANKYINNLNIFNQNPQDYNDQQHNQQPKADEKYKL